MSVDIMDCDLPFSKDSVEYSEQVRAAFAKRIARLVREAHDLAAQRAQSSSRNSVAREDIKVALNELIATFARDLQQHSICTLFDDPRAIGLQEMSLSVSSAASLDELLTRQSSTFTVPGD
jgi:hypothetical protein